ADHVVDGELGVGEGSFHRCQVVPEPGQGRGDQLANGIQRAGVEVVRDLLDQVHVLGGWHGASQVGLLGWRIRATAWLGGLRAVAGAAWAHGGEASSRPEVASMKAAVAPCTPYAVAFEPWWVMTMAASAAGMMTAASITQPSTWGPGGG